MGPPPISDDERRILEERAARIAKPAATFHHVDGEGLLVVRAGRDRYALPAQFVRAVAELTRLTRVPHAPPSVAGFASFRGEVVVVFYLHGVLGLPPALSEHGRMLVFDDGFALAVDAVERVIDATDASSIEVRPPPEGLSAAVAPLIEGVHDDGVVRLRHEALLASDRLVVDIPRAPVGS